jgi:hypothetical protein
MKKFREIVLSFNILISGRTTNEPYQSFAFFAPPMLVVMTGAGWVTSQTTFLVFLVMTLVLLGGRVTSRSQTDFWSSIFRPFLWGSFCAIFLLMAMYL